VAAADEWDPCVKLSDDLAVAGCSPLIDSHQCTGRSLARLYARRGGAYPSQDDLDHAMADFNESMRITTYPSAYNNRGNTWYRRGDFDRAIADCNLAIKLEPKYGSAYSNRGSAKGAQGDLDRAIADFDQAIQLDPNDGEAYYNRGSAWGEGRSRPGHRGL
jgi:tetratricopeptide (TPR) repeat protein